ncbi:MAG: hypothetical protein ACK4QP_15280 [Pseudorhizobium sp.]
MNGVKDSFAILADEITLIRHEIAQLRRTSLNKDEAEALNQQLVQGVASMAQTGQAVYEAISERMDLRLEKLRLEATIAATEAASGAIEKSHVESLSAARSYSKAAGEARREAWRYFGGFWVWLASVGAGGAVLGLLAAFLIVGRGDADQFGQYPGVYCTTAGGQVVTNPEGRRFCAIWIDRPSQSGG